MRRLALISLLLAGGWPAPAAAAPGPALQVISLAGDARADGQPVKAGAGTLAAGGNLSLAPGAVAQLLLGGVAVSVSGPARLRLEDPHLGAMEFAGPGTLRVAGGPALVRVGKIVMSLRSGSAMLFHRRCLFSMSGKVLVQSPSGEASFQLLSGKRKSLGPGCTPELLTDGSLKILSRRVDRFQSPATWTPPVTEIGLEDIQQAEGSVQRERQAQRETAACGCTEGGGTGEGVGDGKGGTGSTPETFTTPVQVKVRGVPKGVLK